MRMSSLVGMNMSGNGAMLIFGKLLVGLINLNTFFKHSATGYNCSSDVNRKARAKARMKYPPGPTTTSVVDRRSSSQSQNPLAGFVIEDGGIPAWVSLLIQIMLILQSIGKQAPFSLRNMRLLLQSLFATLGSLIFGSYAQGTASQRISTYFVMSHDSNEATLTMKDGKPLYRAPAEGRSEHFTVMKAILNKFIEPSAAKIGCFYLFGNFQPVNLLLH